MGRHKHIEEEWVSQGTRDEGGRYPKDWISTVAIDGSLKGAPGKNFVSIMKKTPGFDVVQYQHSGNVICAQRCEVFALRKTLEQAVLPLIVLADNLE